MAKDKTEDSRKQNPKASAKKTVAHKIRQTRTTRKTQPSLSDRFKRLSSDRKTLGLTSGAAVVVVLLLVSGYAYFAQNNAQQAFLQAVSNLSRQDAVNSRFEVATKTDGKLQAYNGDFHFTRGRQTNDNFEAKMKLSFDKAPVDFTLRRVDKTYYARIKGLDQALALLGNNQPSQTQSPIAQLLLQNLNDTWFKISPKTAEQIESRSAAAADTKKANLEKVADIYQEHPFFKIDELSDEDIDGVRTNHFVMQINHEQLIKSLQAIQQADIPSLQISDERIAMAQQNKAKLEQARFATWISQNDEQFKRIRFFNASTPDQYLQTTFQPVSQTRKPVIAAPKQAEDLSPLLQLLLSQPAGGSLPPASVR